jgi:SAM-dependent methyltransferase
MSSPQEWDERFRSGSHVDPTADPFLERSRQYWELMPAHPAVPGSTEPGRAGVTAAALDVACGAGRHAVALAEAGFAVTAVDFAREGLRAGEQLAQKRGVSVDWVERDLEDDKANRGEDLYDLAAVFFFLHRPLLPVLRRCLKPGGLLVYKTYSVDQLRYAGRPSHHAYLLEHNELLRAFAGFRVLVYEEQWEGKGTTALIAQKL